MNATGVEATYLVTNCCKLKRHHHYIQLFECILEIVCEPPSSMQTVRDFFLFSSFQFVFHPASYSFRLERLVGATFRRRRTHDCCGGWNWWRRDYCSPAYYREFPASLLLLLLLCHSLYIHLSLTMHSLSPALPRHHHPQVYGFEPKFAIPLSNFTILGCSIMNVLLNLSKRHPDVDRPLVGTLKSCEMTRRVNVIL